MITLLLGVGIIIYLLFKIIDSTDVPKIRGLPEAFGWPIFGSLFQLGTNHSLALSKLSKKLGPVFQIRLGNKRIIIA
ncbi:unnamed protein product, partial [Adineta ricciae]